VSLVKLDLTAFEGGGLQIVFDGDIEFVLEFHLTEFDCLGNIDRQNILVERELTAGSVYVLITAKSDVS